MVLSTDTVAEEFAAEDAERIPEAEFWTNEFTPGLAVPTRIEDLLIYELHVNALGFGENRPGNLQDALNLLPYLSDLGINAVELLPMSECSGEEGWGYGYRFWPHRGKVHAQWYASPIANDDRQ